MNKLSLFLTIVGLQLCFNVVAQNLYNNNLHWYFGEHCEIDFASGSPVANSVSTIPYGYEGCVSQCNSVGDLLFYTDGVYLWDANHNLVTGTLLNATAVLLVNPNPWDPVHPINSSSQAICVPHPTLPDHYVLFCTRAVTPTTSDVVGVNVIQSTTTSTSIVYSGLCQMPVGFNSTHEAITAVQKCDGNGHWIICAGRHPNGTLSSSFLVYDLDASTFANTSASLGLPSVQTFNGTISSDYTYLLKASPDSRHIAVAHRLWHGLTLYDFDAHSGTISNQIIIDNGVPSDMSWYYGLSFSPNSKYMYTARRHTNSSSDVYDLVGFEVADPLTSMTFISPLPQSAEYAHPMSLGPDNRIYMSSLNPELHKGIHCIRNPNNLSAPNFVQDDITFSAFPSTVLPRALPTFLDARGIWPKSTANPSHMDVGRDIATDQFGGVYALGEYHVQSTVESVNYVSPRSGWEMYLTKYDECGAVDWRVYSVGALGSYGDCRPSGVALDEANGRVYVVGHYDGVTEFYGELNSAFGTATSTDGFILTIDMFTGEILDLWHDFTYLAPGGLEFDIRSVAVDPGSSDVYVTGRIANGSGWEIMTVKYQALSNFAQSVWESPTTTLWGMSNVNIGKDIALDSQGDPVVTGSIDSDVGYIGGSSDFLPGTTQDMFIMKYDRNTGNVIMFTQAHSDNIAEGNSVTVMKNPADRIVAVGSYSGNMNQPFGASSPSTAPQAIGFAVAIDGMSPPVWMDYGLSGDPNVATGITSDDNNVYMSGYSEPSGITTFPSELDPSNLGVVSANMYQRALDASGFFQWATSTSGANINKMTNVAVNDHYVFSTGHYTGIVSLPPTQNLIPPSPGSMIIPHAFVARTDVSNGDYKIDLSSDDHLESAGFDLYPNPATNILNVSWFGDEGVSYRVINLTGEVVLAKTIENRSGAIDVSGLTNGIYLFELTRQSGKSETKKFIIQ